MVNNDGSLPPLEHLSKVAEQQAVATRKQQILQSALETAIETPADAQPSPQPDSSPPVDSKSNPGFFAKLGGRRKSQGLNKKGQYEPFEVLRAIERRDLMTLNDIKLQSFDLLVSGTPLPLVYALRQGKSHHEVQIFLVGAMSRKVNDLPDDDLADLQPSTLATLRALRANLKIAITASLSSHENDTSLLSSFLQVIVMLEGTKFLHSSTQTLSLALRTPLASKPVETARGLMLKWVSRELKERQVASVDEYLANGTGDLILLGLWSVVQDQLPAAEPVPLYFFARDDRIQKAVEERLSHLRRTSPSSLTRLSKLYSDSEV
ncbi:hypothetical protein Rhopal_003910-T1 [Rhodotorula paludigena]|uniref:Uncharacterized protein n=1 Tax=Rhodotorula paludigena TaxID=86838 RepID=A0AAV5GMY0_9BASI|nr:hypothetical protein Rhopal_003910-T1 [Rhodotorula paludigena]